MVYFIKVIICGSWLENTVQWCRQMKRNMFGGVSCIKIKSKLKLPKPNTELKSEVIFPPEVVGKLSLAFQIPNFKSVVMLSEAEDLLQMLISICDLVVSASGRFTASGLSSFIAD